MYKRQKLACEIVSANVCITVNCCYSLYSEIIVFFLENFVLDMQHCQWRDYIVGTRRQRQYRALTARHLYGIGITETAYSITM